MLLTFLPAAAAAIKNKMARSGIQKIHFHFLIFFFFNFAEFLVCRKQKIVTAAKGITIQAAAATTTIAVKTSGEVVKCAGVRHIDRFSIDRRSILTVHIGMSMSMSGEAHIVS